MNQEQRLIEDKLDRQDFIKFVENLIINSNNYKRDNDSKSYVMALDSAWGTGKSYFIDLLIQDIKKENEIFVVKYNAWKNDYCNNAFNPLIYDILKSDAIIFDTENDADIKNVKKILTSIGKIGLTIGKQMINKKIKDDYGIEIDKAVDEAIDSGEHIKNFMFRITENLEQLNEQRESFSDLKTCLATATRGLQKDGKKLVVIIDELDRCKPTFAIQTLEIVKHIFDIENIVFLFAVDIEQLSHSISSVYGQNFDSVGYLCRFFDYIAKLPNPRIEKFIAYKLEKVGFDTQNPNIIKTNKFICDLIDTFNLSLRDIDTIIQSYKILYDTKLKDYKIFDSNLIYIYYLTLKYKKPDIYYKIFISKTESTDSIYKLIQTLNYDSSNTYLHKSLNNIYKNDLLYEIPFNLYDEFDLYKTHLRIEKIINNILYEKSSNVYYNVSEFHNLDNILFYPDMLKWKEISTYTYREYIHKQLENYNFSCFDDTQSHTTTS